MSTGAERSTRRALGPGKVPADVLCRLLAKFRNESPDVVVGPGLGLDAAVIKPRSRYLVVTSDPITLTCDLMPYYCLHVNANDLAVMGAEPQFMTVVCLLPVGGAEVIERLSGDLARYAKALNVTIIGGHTEITPAVNAPVMVGTMMGRLISPRPIGACGARVGDVVVMTKHAALEATTIIARERPKRLRRAKFTESEIRRAQRLLFRPGISILPEARIALGRGCSALHDATEGGVLTGLWELAMASGVRIRVHCDQIPVLPMTIRMCRLWDIDPLGAISSGALLTTIGSRRVTTFLAELKVHGILATVIGEVVRGRSGVEDVASGRMLEPVPDEIVKLYR